LTQHALKDIVKYGLNNQQLSKGCAESILEDMDKQKKILIIAGYIPDLRKAGYKVKLYLLRLPDSEFAVARVKQRVKEGGHNVPEDVVRRRYHSGLSNFETLYKPIADEWVLVDNAGEQPPSPPDSLQGEPEWPLLSVPGAEYLPAMRWKLINIRRMTMPWINIYSKRRINL